MKMLLTFYFMCLISNTYAIDIQSEAVNSDKSLFQSIADYQTIETGRVFISNSTELASNPLIDKNKNILDVYHNDTGVLTGLYSNIELGANLSYKKTNVKGLSTLQSFSGVTSFTTELKWNFYKTFAIVPVYVKQLDNSFSVGKQNDSIGLKLIGGFFDETKTPLFMQFFRSQSDGAKYEKFDQSTRDQISIGALYRISRSMIIGSELLYDSFKGNNSKDLLIHGTAHYDLLSFRGGFGSGFLNKNKQNESRIFLTIMFDLDFRKEKAEKVLKDR